MGEKFDFLSGMDSLDYEEKKYEEGRTLHLLDLTPIFYWVSQQLSDCFNMAYIQQFIYQVAKIITDKDDLVVCADNSPTKKMESIDGAKLVYKKNRKEIEPHLKRHRAMLNFGAQIICDQLGITYQSIEGYEADDMIYNTIQKYRDMYDKIVIHSADSDMLFMIDNQVSVDRGRFGFINMQNYFSIFSGTQLQYNTVTFYCICKKNKDNRGMLGSRMYPKILELIKGVDPRRFCLAEDTISIASEFLDESQMNVLRLALPMTIINTSDEVELLSPSKCDLNKLGMFYQVMCKRDFSNQVFVETYERLINFYGGM